MSHYIRTIYTDYTRTAAVQAASAVSASTQQPYQQPPTKISTSAVTAHRSRDSLWSSSPPSLSYPYGHAYAGTSASAHANLLVGLGGLMNRYPPGLGHDSSSSDSDWAYPSSHSPPVTRRSPPPPPKSTSSAHTHSSYRTTRNLNHQHHHQQLGHSGHGNNNNNNNNNNILMTRAKSYIKFDPFSDENSIDTIPVPAPRYYNHDNSNNNSDGVLYRTPRNSIITTTFDPKQTPTPASAPTPVSHPTTTTVLPKQKSQTSSSRADNFSSDRNARSKLVAGILLNRVHAVGKPMRPSSILHSINGNGVHGTGGRKEYVKSGLSRVVCVGA